MVCNTRSVVAANAIAQRVVDDGECHPTATVPPLVTSANATTFTVLSAGTFTVTATGTPAPALMQSGTLPSGVTFHRRHRRPGRHARHGTVGSYPLTFTATNGSGVVMQRSRSRCKSQPDHHLRQPWNAKLYRQHDSAYRRQHLRSHGGLCQQFAERLYGVRTNLTLVTTGVCSITASQAGNADYNVATDVTRAFSVNAANQTITFNTQSPSAAASSPAAPSASIHWPPPVPA